MGVSETARFYKALSLVGTDFSLMCNLFPSRSRRDLKVLLSVQVGGWRLCANSGECLLERTSPKTTKRSSLKMDSLKCDQTTTSKKAREKRSYKVAWSSQFRWSYEGGISSVLLTLKLPPPTPLPPPPPMLLLTTEKTCQTKWGNLWTGEYDLGKGKRAVVSDLILWNEILFVI